MATKAKTNQPPATNSEQVIIDENGTTATLKGFGWARDFHLDLDPRIDLTKPIWEQVQKLRRHDKRTHDKRTASKSKAAA